MARGLKGLAIGTGFVAVISLVMYPIYFYPRNHIAEYKQTQKTNRQAVDPSTTQPADLKIWSDPFSRK